MKTVVDFDQGMARALMITISILQDDLHDFQRLPSIQNGDHLSARHTWAYNQILDAKERLEFARILLAHASVIQ